MKKILLLTVILAGLLLFALHRPNNTISAKAVAATTNVVDAPMTYLKTSADAEKSMEKNVDVTSLNNAIQQFQVQEGHYPKDLDELVTEHYLGVIPTPPHGYKLAYDPAAGSVAVVQQ